MASTLFGLSCGAHALGYGAGNGRKIVGHGAGIARKMQARDRGAMRLSRARLFVKCCSNDADQGESQGVSVKSPSLENEETEAPSTSIVSEIESAIQEVETPAEVEEIEVGNAVENTDPLLLNSLETSESFKEAKPTIVDFIDEIEFQATVASDSDKESEVIFTFPKKENADEKSTAEPALKSEAAFSTLESREEEQLGTTQKAPEAAPEAVFAKSSENGVSRAGSPEVSKTSEVEESPSAETLLAKQLAAERHARQRAEQLLAEKEMQTRELEMLRQREIELRNLVEERERKLQMLEDQREAEKRKKVFEMEAFQTKVQFSTPEVFEAGKSGTIYFQPSLSAIKSQGGSIWVKGAFNDWDWKPFHIEMEPVSSPEDEGLSGEWWKCEVEIPKESFNAKFVFRNGKNQYDNNGGKDFTVTVEGGMTKAQFAAMIAQAQREEAERAEAAEAERLRKEEEKKKEIEERAKKEADRVKAMEELAGIRQAGQVALGKAVRGLLGVWYTVPDQVEAGQRMELRYNRSWRPLWNSSKLWMHAGRNNWATGLDLVVEFQKLEGVPASDGEDWWSAEFEVPPGSFVLSWVMADGPPGEAQIYDNNSQQDYITLVGGVEQQRSAMESFYSQLEEETYLRMEAERKEREAKAEQLAVRRRENRLALKQRTKQAYLEMQQHILYTEPSEVQAGQPVKVYYNPSCTVLNGRQEVWIRGSFNRWTHPLGLFPRQKMQSVDGSTHLVAEIDVPLDAYCMDFVFSDNGNDGGGLYDNKGGLDYHVPVVGGLAKAPPMYIVHVALEMAPIAKVGGLGDVVTSLSRAVLEAGHVAEVILPKYDCINYNLVQNLEQRHTFSWGNCNIRCWTGTVEGVTVHFLEPENGMFWVGCIYGRKDDGERFGFFCNAALEFLIATNKRPDILHCHDWSSAPTAFLFSQQYRHYGLNQARTVFTIHNLEFGQALIGKAMEACNKATTVSPTYAMEVSGHPAISPHLGKFHGILNGIDFDIWDPLVDPFLPVPYESANVVEGKQAAKRELQLRLGLANEDRPLVGVVSRLTAQKGIHLIKQGVYRTLERGGQVVLLGSAPDGRIQAEFQQLAASLSQSHPDSARFWLSYDEPLSHLIYAACDIILVPSIFEPCGLTQMIAMRYGAIPVVRKTGGLNDTVFDVDHDKERAQALRLEVNGFSFEGTDNAAIDYALNRAITTWYESRDFWNSLAKRVMEQDWSWNKPALDYIELYYGARK